MIGDSNNKIGTRELTAIIMYLLGIELSDTTPTNLIDIGKNAGWMVPIISGIIAFISLGFLLKLLKRYGTMGLLDLIFHLTGKYIGFIIGMLLFFIMFFFTAINTRSYVDMISDMFYLKTPIIVIYAILIGSSYFVASKGFEGIGRTSYITQPYVLTALLVFTILILNQCKFEYLRPIFGSGLKNIVKGGITNSSIFGEIILMSVFYPLVRGYKEYKVSSILGLSFGIIMVSFFTALYIGVFDFPPANIINYPFHTASRLIYAGRFIGNLEAFFSIFWLVASIVRYSVYIYLGAAFLAYTLKLKEFNKLLLPFAGATLMLGMIPENYFQVIDLIKRSLLSYSWALIYLLPIILFILSSIKGDYKTNNN